MTLPDQRVILPARAYQDRLRDRPCDAHNQFFFGDPGDRLIAGDWGIVDETDTPAFLGP